MEDDRRACGKGRGRERCGMSHPGSKDQTGTHPYAGTRCFRFQIGRKKIRLSNVSESTPAQKKEWKKKKKVSDRATRCLPNIGNFLSI